MNYFISVFLTSLFLKVAHLEDMQLINDQQKEKTFPVAVMSDEGNGTTEAGSSGVPVKNAGLSPETLSELHNFAKNISHGKGIYRETDKEEASMDDLEIRRSVLKKVAVASESDAMKAILQRFDYEENKVHLLEQMEFLVHQYDVAVNFAVGEGVQVIAPLLFSSDDDIVSSVASVLGAAMQSNPTVQKVAMKHNVGRNLLQLLSHKSPTVLSRVIFALSSLLRNSPEAQKEFVTLNGVSKLADILKNDQISANTKLKVINLFNDLTVEQQTAQLYPSDHSSENILELERLFAYEIQKWDVCHLISLFLDLEDFDTHQKIVSAMISVHSTCHMDFKNTNIINRLKKLLKIYDPDSDGEEPVYPAIDKDLKISLHSELISLMRKINEKTLNKSTIELSKTEL